MGTYIQKLLMGDGVGERERVLALNGDFWSDTNPFVLALRREDGYRLFDTFDPLYGCPVYGKDGPPLSVPVSHGGLTEPGGDHSAGASLAHGPDSVCAEQIPARPSAM